MNKVLKEGTVRYLTNKEDTSYYYQSNPTWEDAHLRLLSNAALDVTVGQKVKYL